MQIDREDMLELTRRMTIKRNCFTRLAGAYVEAGEEIDTEGFAGESFNIHFLKLSPGDQEKNLRIAKTVPFSQTNRQLTLHPFPGDTAGGRALRQLLLALNGCGLKNDALLDALYEQVAACHQAPGGYAIYVFHGSYDVPRKASDHKRLWESEEVYDFLILCLCPLAGDYEPDLPEWGFLYPAFTGRSSDADHIAVFEAEPERPHSLLVTRLLGIRS